VTSIGRYAIRPLSAEFSSFGGLFLFEIWPSRTTEMFVNFCDALFDESFLEQIEVLDTLKSWNH